mmetsp:Transcript_41476/g.89651  ORF Transcript_41476/g.89651 Transcript_41476/m.89651 type:complete len:246 (+) Transcript_41476:134-871(+)|eukprot:CAMPEP_0206538560 /NCGR_PEP_ID=MMETSP0325_2-20121206/7935_1 /ASSEMBLY_ACC=CAM_ASM_000347 /TAXON_ID=2866 /ORGANISM="Crypthecodinium cohnii, Strain Seligo" /LENGTH=245 /DNA_ID=CAMNT_0054036021 /DNA_START=278 /DNA_END=1015 /DNA_ORIENTATION=-
MAGKAFVGYSSLQPGHDLTNVGTPELNKYIAVCEDFRLDQRRNFDARSAKMSTKVNLLSKQKEELLAAHAKVLESDRASALRAIASLETSSERNVSRLQERLEALRTARVQAEAEAARLEEKAQQTHRSCVEAHAVQRDTWITDDPTFSAPFPATPPKRLACLSEVDGADANLREEHLPVVEPVRREIQITKTQKPRPLPFGLPSHETVFEGLGKHGARPPLQWPDTYQGDLQRTRVPRWGNLEL